MSEDIRNQINVLIESIRKKQKYINWNYNIETLKKLGHLIYKMESMKKLLVEIESKEAEANEDPSKQMSKKEIITLQTCIMDDTTCLKCSKYRKFQQYYYIQSLEA